MAAWGTIVSIVVGSLVSYGVYFVLDWMNATLGIGSTVLTVALTSFCGVMTFIFVFTLGIGEQTGLQTEFEP